jgi:hypothetical protein
MCPWSGSLGVFQPTVKSEIMQSRGGAWTLWVVVTAADPRVTQALDLRMTTTDGAIVTDCIWTNSAPHREASRWLGPNVHTSDGVPDAAHLDL